VPVMVALLRGVNVGGKGKLAMTDLRRAAEECGLEDVATYIQSGNVVFSTSSNSTGTVARRLRDAVSELTDVEPEVVVRTREQLRAVVEENPYLERGEDVAHLHVVFASGDAEASLASVDLAAYAPEEATAMGQQLYMFLPSGLGRSKLAADLTRRGGRSGTTRNWRTVTKLMDMADAIA